MGAAVALPLLDAMVPALTATAKTAANPRSRFGAVYVPHGAIMEQWTPATAGAGFDVHADPEAARAVPGSAGRRQQPRSAAAATTATPSASAAWLSGAIAEEDRRPRTSRLGTTIDQVIAKQIGQDTPFPSLELATEDFTRLRRRLQHRLQLRLHEHHLVGVADDAAADGDQPARRVRAAVRPGRHRRAARWRACGAGPQHPRLGRGGRRATASAGWARATASRLGEYLDNVREIERRIQRAESAAATREVHRSTRRSACPRPTRSTRR